MRSRHAAAIVLGLLLLAAPGGADERADPDRVAVLDAGTFVVVEARQAPLGLVLDRLAKHLNATLSNTGRLDLSRIVDGRVRGSVFDVVRWLVPDTNFILVYADAPEPRNRKLERIGFLGDKGPTGPAVASPAASAPDGPAAAGEPAAPSPAARGTVPSVETTAASPPDPDLRSDGSKPDAAHSEKSEIKSVAEQLEALTPQAQLAIERRAHTKDGGDPPPEFLRPKSDAAQTTLQQQAERSQALAVEQLRALMDAYRTACATPPCPPPGTPAPSAAPPSPPAGGRPDKGR